MPDCPKAEMGQISELASVNSLTLRPYSDVENGTICSSSRINLLSLKGDMWWGAWVA